MIMGLVLYEFVLRFFLNNKKDSMYKALYYFVKKVLS